MKSRLRNTGSSEVERIKGNKVAICCSRGDTDNTSGGKKERKQRKKRVDTRVSKR